MNEFCSQDLIRACGYYPVAIPPAVDSSTILKPTLTHSTWDAHSDVQLTDAAS
jgi:hypothetical protein